MSGINIKMNLQKSAQQHHALPGKVTDQIFGTVSPHYNQRGDQGMIGWKNG